MVEVKPDVVRLLGDNLENSVESRASRREYHFTTGGCLRDDQGIVAILGNRADADGLRAGLAFLQGQGPPGHNDEATVSDSTHQKAHHMATAHQNDSGLRSSDKPEQTEFQAAHDFGRFAAIDNVPFF